MRRFQLRLVHLLGALLATLAAITIVLAIFVGLFRLAAALTPHARSDVERWCAIHLGLRLRLENMNLVWRRFHPEFVMTGVELLGRGTHTGLAVERLGVGISWTALLHGRLAPAWLELDGLALALRQDPAGHWRLPVAFTPLLVATSGARAFHRFEGELRVHDARLTIRAPSLGQHSLLVLVRDLTLTSREQRAQLRFVGLVPTWGADPLEFHYVGRGRHPWEVWAAKTDWRLRWRLPLPHLGRFLVLFHPSWRASEPHGRLRTEGDVEGRGLVFDGRAGLVLSSLSWRREGKRLAPVELRLRADIRSGAGRTAILVPRLEILPKARPAPPPATLRILIHQRKGATVIHFSTPLLALSSLRLPLEAMTQFSPHPGWVRRLARLSPHGSFVHLRVRIWSAPHDGPLAWTVHAYLLGLSTAAVGRAIPALVFPPLHLVLGDRGGTVTVGRGAIEIGPTGVPGERSRISTHGFAVDYRATPSGWEASLPETSLRLPGGRGSLRGRLFTATGTTPVVNLVFSSPGLAIAPLSQAIPSAWLGPGFAKWLETAFPAGGELTHVRLVWHGPLMGEAHPHGAGSFRAQARFHAPRLVYARDWPVLQGLNADLLYRQGRFEAVLRRGAHIEGWVPSHVRLEIGARWRTGHLVIGLQGPVSPFARVLRATPVFKRMPLLQGLRFPAGSLAGRAMIAIPFDHPDGSRVQGKLALANVTIADGSPATTMTGLRGHVAVTATGGVGWNVEGDWLGTPFFSTATPTPGGLRLVAHGDLAGRALVHAFTGDDPSWIRGTSPWTLVGRVHATGVADVVWSSSLRGILIALHAPLGKRPSTVRPLRVRVRSTHGEIHLRGRYGHLFKVFLDLSHGAAHAQGAIAIGPTRPVFPSSGLAIEGSLSRFDLRDLQPLLALVTTPPAATSPTSTSAWPVALNGLRIAQVDGYGQHFGPLVLTGSLSPGPVHLTLTSPTVDGTLSYLLDHAHPRGWLRLAFARLDLARPWSGGRRQGEGKNLRHHPSSPAPQSRLPSPGSFPALSLQSRNTHLGRMDLGTIQARFVPAPHAWILRSLRSRGPGYRLVAHGYWARHDGVDHVRYTFTIRSHDLHTAFLAFGLTPLMTGHSALIRADLGWHGVPWRIDRPTLSGVLDLVAHHGRVLPLNPGAGRLLGLLSLSSLPRRLGFDFSDVFDRGLGYDTIEGHFAIRRGIALTRSLVLRGPAVHLVLEGRTDIVHETYDQVVQVIPLVSSSFPLAGALVGGPVGFAALLVLSRMLSLPLRSMLATYYHISGSWSHPLVRHINDDEARKLGFRSPPRS